MPEIIYSDENVIIINKPIGVPSEGEMVKEVSLFSGGEVWLLHRIDTGVGGALAFARNKKAASELSKMIAEHNGFDKYYLLVTSRTPDEVCGSFEDYLFKDSRKNKVYPVKSLRKGAKYARLDYRVAERGAAHTLTCVHMLTGRTHQIRVQFASRKMPLCGDGKYGSRERGDIALFSHRIIIDYPAGNRIDVSVFPTQGFFSEFALNSDNTIIDLP